MFDTHQNTQNIFSNMMAVLPFWLNAVGETPEGQSTLTKWVIFDGFSPSDFEKCEKIAVSMNLDLKEYLVLGELLENFLSWITIVSTIIEDSSL